MAHKADPEPLPAKVEDVPPEREWTLDSDGDGLGLDDIVNRLDSFQLLRKSDDAEADRLLDEMGASSGIDRGHRASARSETTTRSPGTLRRSALARRSLAGGTGSQRSIARFRYHRWGLITPIVRFLVQIVTQFIVRSYVSSFIDGMHRLYERREAAALASYEHLPMLSRARIQTERIKPGFKRGKLALPRVLVRVAPSCRR